MNNGERPDFSITRTYDAPPDLVWRAWTDEAELAQWLRPFGVTSEAISFDVRVGGSYEYTMVNADTGERYPTGGTYLEVEPITRLVFTWGVPGDPVSQAPVITLTLRPVDDGARTELVFHLAGHPGQPGDDNIYDGWDQALTNLGRHLAGELLG